MQQTPGPRPWLEGVCGCRSHSLWSWDPLTLSSMCAAEASTLRTLLKSSLMTPKTFADVDYVR